MAHEGKRVKVAYVQKKDVKVAKTFLESENVLDKDFRITACACNDCQACREGWMGLPVLREETCELIQGYGEQFCRFSASYLASEQYSKSLTEFQKALLEVALAFDVKDALPSIQSLSIKTCPKKIELLGDDTNLVVAQKALSLEQDDYRVFLEHMKVDPKSFQERLWLTLAKMTNSKRVIRRSEVDPDSGIRKSGYVILWPPEMRAKQTSNDSNSPGWITVTENGIRQSFDLTLVMFSRGNVNEKMRFGNLVQEGERVLDLYAGIGYFTLPALVHGKAAQVVACEWNPQAIRALRYNLQDNHVESRATVLEGDCRKTTSHLLGTFDRVSLGLIPSSEGGWETAVSALNLDRGGWLHVHGNVQVTEVEYWALCLSRQLRNTAEARHLQWVAVVKNTVKVKSFAPSVNHYVADVFLGPVDRGRVELELPGLVNDGTGVLKEAALQQAPVSMDPPSCALSKDGILHQEWMR